MNEKPFAGVLFASDFDHTLSAPDGTVPEANRAGIRRFIDAGGRLHRQRPQRAAALVAAGACAGQRALPLLQRLGLLRLSGAPAALGSSRWASTRSGSSTPPSPLTPTSRPRCRPPRGISCAVNPISVHISCKRRASCRISASCRPAVDEARVLRAVRAHGGRGDPHRAPGRAAAADGAARAAAVGFFTREAGDSCYVTRSLPACSRSVEGLRQGRPRGA